MRDGRSRRLDRAWFEHAAAAGVFALAACVNAWDWLAADRMVPGDFPGYAAQVQYVRDALIEHGRVPLWCVECYGGTTNFTSNLKEYVAFPIALVFEPVRATKIAFLLLRVLAALGLYALVARHFSAPAAGIVAGYAYAFGAIANYQYESLDAALSAALLPPILLAALALIARSGARAAIALGVLGACQVANNWVHAVPAAFAVGLVTPFGLWRTRGAADVRAAPRLPMRWAAAAIAVFFAFAGSQLAWIASDTQNHRLIPPENAASQAGLLISRSPFLFLNRANVFGPWLAEHHPPDFDLVELDAGRRYVGVVALALITAGGFAARRDPELLRWAGLAGSALFVPYWLSLGPRTLLWEVAESLHVPAGTQAAASAALRAITVACVLAAGGFGLAARAWRRSAHAARVRLGVCAGCALLAYFPTASLWSAGARVMPSLALQRSPGHYFDLAHFWFALLLALGLVALQRRFARRRLAAWIAVTAAVGVMVDFWPSRRIFSAGVPMEDLRRAGELAASLPGAHGTLRIGAGTPPYSYSPAASWIAAQGTAGLAWGWLNWRAGAHWPELVDRAMAAALASRDEPLIDTSVPLFEAARVRYWLVPNPNMPLPDPWRRVRSAPAFVIWEQPAVSPMAAGFREVWLGDDSDEPALLVARAHEHHAVVVSGADAARFATDRAASRVPPAPLLPVTYHQPEPEHIVLEVDAGAEPAMIFVSEGYHPWWRATVDGASAPVLRAQLALLAVPVGPGAHRIGLELERPAVVLAADRVTALSWIALVLGAPPALWIRARRR